eukprot:scaffold1376_cov257-Pinguiococcus_pyrenoidosus.AAC.1
MAFHVDAEEMIAEIPRDALDKGSFVEQPPPLGLSIGGMPEILEHRPASIAMDRHHHRLHILYAASVALWRPMIAGILTSSAIVPLPLGHRARLHHPGRVVHRRYTE